MAACGCGRSPTGNCIGWHKLTEQEYELKRRIYEEKQKLKEQENGSKKR